MNTVVKYASWVSLKQIIDKATHSCRRYKIKK